MPLPGHLTWDGKRSKSNCKSAPDAPGPGTYIATAQLEGAEPVQLRMRLSDSSSASERRRLGHAFRVRRLG